MPILCMADRMRNAILQHTSIPEVAKRELLNVLAQSRRRPPSERATEEWKDLLFEIARTRAGVATNKARWHTTLIPLYTEYIALLDRVSALVKRESLKYETINECIKATRQKNEERLNSGDTILGERNHHWQSWVPPHVRADLALRVEATYAERARQGETTALRGKRFKPFQPAYERTNFDRQMERIRKAIKNLREAARTDAGQLTKHRAGAQYATANTPYRALILTACRRADRTLSLLEQRVDSGQLPVYDAVVPVNWLALLSRDLRTRLADARQAPLAVSTDGLDSFYAPDPGLSLAQGNEFAPELPDDDEEEMHDPATTDNQE